MDNASQFLSLCNSLKLHHTFESAELISRTGDANVVYTLLDVSRAVSRWVAPPLIVQYELEIEAEEKNHKDSSSEMNDSVSVSGADDSETCMSETTSQVGTTEYKPQEGDAIDQALAEEINREKLSFPLRRTAKGTYSVQQTNSSKPEKLHVRIVRGIPLIRVGGGWVNVKSFVKSKSFRTQKRRDVAEVVAQAKTRGEMPALLSQLPQSQTENKVAMHIPSAEPPMSSSTTQIFMPDLPMFQLFPEETTTTHNEDPTQQKESLEQAIQKNESVSSHTRSFSSSTPASTPRKSYAPASRKSAVSQSTRKSSPKNKSSATPTLKKHSTLSNGTASDSSATPRKSPRLASALSSSPESFASPPRSKSLSSTTLVHKPVSTLHKISETKSQQSASKPNLTATPARASTYIAGNLSRALSPIKSVSTPSQQPPVTSQTHKTSKSGLQTNSKVSGSSPVKQSLKRTDTKSALEVSCPPTPVPHYALPLNRTPARLAATREPTVKSTLTKSFLKRKIETPTTSHFAVPHSRTPAKLEFAHSPSKLTPTKRKNESADACLSKSSEYGPLTRSANMQNQNPNLKNDSLEYSAAQSYRQLAAFCDDRPAEKSRKKQDSSLFFSPTREFAKKKRLSSAPSARLLDLYRSNSSLPPPFASPAKTVLFGS